MNQEHIQYQEDSQQLQQQADLQRKVKNNIKRNEPEIQQTTKQQPETYLDKASVSMFHLLMHKS